MRRNRTMPGALAALTAVVCVLGPAAFAMASGGGAGDLLPGPGRCASPTGEGERIVPGLTRPAAGPAPNGGAVSTLCVTVRPAGIGPGAGRVGGIRSAQNDADLQETAPREDQIPTDAPQDTETLTETPTETPPAASADRPFEGNPRPASPDLTVTEERALISGGWE